jgi:hypothetical protein
VTELTVELRERIKGVDTRQHLLFPSTIHGDVIRSNEMKAHLPELLGDRPRQLRV